ncbi:hypothetical protein Lfu02_61580 [Longispora fulva]|uniref:K+-sensing histidine kinase KdpD n=1 Tax=Longispora fulva TaxID=619741 RepID=A0A8J7GKG8_9ACTN|nr:hypothetical protein [Longispora fulva]MBG6134579.1 K+-sensing histidine kinase KdpD [Longispora fulva]GIG61786.1 hypothetical protein Lfu02_61580 [Longispora fulva]
MWVRSGGWARGSEETPLGVNIALGSVLLVVAAVAAATIPDSEPVVRYAVLVLAVAAFAAWTRDGLALAFVAVIGFAIFNGFLVNQPGELSWHGLTDMLRLGVLVLASTTGLAAGEAYRLVRRPHRPRPWVKPPVASELPGKSFNEEEKHGA